MDFGKLLISFDEEHRRTTLSFIVCTLIFYSVFYASSDFYRNIEWHNQLLFALGISACYIGTTIFLFIWLIELKYLSYLTIPMLSLPAMSEFVFSTRMGVFDFNRFLISFLICFLITLLLSILRRLNEEIERRRETVEENDNTEI